MKHKTIHWFRKGLRLHDNPALLHAVTTSDVVYPVFIFDKEFNQKHDNIGSKRMRFLFDCLEDLRKNLKSKGSNLYIFLGDTATILKEKVKEWKITQLTFITDTELFYKDRDRNVTEMLKELGAITESKIGHTLYDIEEVLDSNNGRAPLTYRRFVSVVSKLPEVAKPVPSITANHFQSCSTPISEHHDEENQCPTLTDVGCKEDVEVMVWHGGETIALDRMMKRLAAEGWTNTSGTSTVTNNPLLPNTTGLSPYFSFGCLSPRFFYHAINNVKVEARKHCLTPSSFQGQLLWRDFFYTVAADTPNFTVMKGNPICLQISWGVNSDHLKRWEEGMTGYPWIDAIMRQLRREGWIHHLARHAVACFLTRGDLWLSWEDGQQVFERHLLDADYSMNAGNWMWLSASAFSHQYTKIFHPVRFGKRTDSTGQYVRSFVKELEHFPSKYIYEPWKAPMEEQIKAKCIIGKDYPLPMVDHSVASAENINRMRAFRHSQADTVKLTTDEVGLEPGTNYGIKRTYEEMCD